MFPGTASASIASSGIRSARSVHFLSHLFLIQVVFVQETRLQVMRDRARAKSAESALFHLHTNVAAVLETARRKQDEMLQRLHDKSSCELARIQDVVTRSHTRISILSAILPASIAKINVNSNAHTKNETIKDVRSEMTKIDSSDSKLKTNSIGGGGEEESMGVENSRQRHLQQWGGGGWIKGKDKNQLVAKAAYTQHVLQDTWSTQNTKNTWSKPNINGHTHESTPRTIPANSHPVAPIQESTSTLTRNDYATLQACEHAHAPTDAEESSVVWHQQGYNMEMNLVEECIGVQRSDAADGPPVVGGGRALSPARQSSRESLGLLLHDAFNRRQPCIKFVTPASPADRAGIQCLIYPLQHMCERAKGLVE